MSEGYPIMHEDVLNPEAAQMVGPVKFDFSLGALSAHTTETTGAIAADDTKAEALASELPEAVVAVDASAPCACIDGRACAHLGNGESTSPRPKVAGGNLVSGYAALEVLDAFPDELKEADQADKFRYVASRLQAGGLTPGGHGQTGSFNAELPGGFGEAGTGCGANDRLPKIMEKFSDPTSGSYAAVDAIAQSLWTLPEGASAPIVDASAAVERTGSWRKSAFTSALAEVDAQMRNIEILEDGHSTGEHLPNHGHAENMIVFNYVENTTVDRDKLAADGTQAFVVDMWYLDKMAGALTNGTPADSEEFLRTRHALTMYQVATALTLTDGSQRLAVMEPDVEHPA